MSREPRPPEPDGISPSGFFVLRTPMLPFDEFLSWSEGIGAERALGEPAFEQTVASDCARLRGRLRALVARSEVREALFVASPDLEESLSVWIRDPAGERGLRIERALVRYFSRMAGRPTPFGLFAGTSVGMIGDRTRLEIEARSKYQRRSRLDMDYLFTLADSIARDPANRAAVSLRPNSTLYRTAGRFHYVETRLQGKERTHHLVAVEDSDELQSTLLRAEKGADGATLGMALVDGDVSRTDAETYVSELIETQILTPELEVAVTGADPGEALAVQLLSRRETSAAGERLEMVIAKLRSIDSIGPGANPSIYRALARELDGLPAPVELPRLFQVDMIKPAPAARLSVSVLAEIVKGIEIMRRIAPPRKEDELFRFREAFVARYEDREVRLVEALDEETGIGFPPSAGGEGDGGPLLKDIAFPSPPERGSWTAQESFVLKKLTEAIARGARKIALDSEDLERLAQKQPSPFPDAFAAMVTVAAASEEALVRGDFRILYQGAEGPSGARLLGRFAFADEELRRWIEEHLRAEEALDPDAVFAEVVHLPEGRLGNVIARPVLRRYEIPYLGRSGAPRDRQIPIDDLFVSVREGRIVLRSARLDRRIVPRVTSAHNFRWKALGTYRFLCELQNQDRVGSMGWSWSPFWSAPFLPRVVHGRLVFWPAQWNLDKKELERIQGSSAAERFRKVQEWRAERGLPSLVLLAEGDNRLPVDFANVLSVEMFTHLVKGRDGTQLVEMFPGPEELVAKGPEGRFVHELIVPFLRTPAPEIPKATTPLRSEKRPATRIPKIRRFPPGSEWIYAKLYASPSLADRVLREIVAPLVRKVLHAGDRWFFIRYGDPDWHLRLRIHGDPAGLHLEVLPVLYEAAAAPIANGWLRTLQLDTYQPEEDRYGGSEALEVIERIFQVDSETVLEVLEMLDDGDEGQDERWRLALRGMDALLGDFGFDLKAKRKLVEHARGEFVKELGADGTVKRDLGDRFRNLSRGLEPLLDPTRGSETPLAPGLAVLERRSEALAPLVRELQLLESEGRLTRSIVEIVPSLIHMHVNRLLRSAHRNQEIVLYDFLRRLYETQAARARSGKSPLSPAEK